MAYVVYSLNDFDTFETEVEALEEFNYRLYTFQSRFGYDDVIVVHSKNENKIFLTPFNEEPIELCHFYPAKGGY
ncbi:hypothetical protein [Jeotgalibaca porci]|uniref:hypothetical protein n=1 Tax=Jeotgalibaca porci TaxID=1868793 RepID=UPI0035A08027